MIIHKITHGFVTQTFDTELGRYTFQEFIADPQREPEFYNDKASRIWGWSGTLDVMDTLPLAMSQPANN